MYDKVVLLLIAPDERRYNIVEVKSWLEVKHKNINLEIFKIKIFT